jgi:hypothetical protein
VSDETPAEQTPDVPAPAPSSPPRPPHAGDAVTDGGYAYTLVDDTGGAKKQAQPKEKHESKPLSIAWPLLVALIVVPAVLVGIGVWFLADAFGDDGGGTSDRAGANVASVIDVFGAAQGGQSVRLEGEAPAALPDDLPVYPGADVLSSLAQTNGDDAVYLIVYDTEARLDDVSTYYADAFGADPWQIDLGQAATESAALQFSKIDDPDIEGQVLLGASVDGDVTTIFLIVQLIGGADEIEFPPFEPPVTKPLPEGFPDAIPPYPDGIVTQTVFQRAPQGDTYGLTIITQDEAESALEFYRSEFEGMGWTVGEGDPGGSGLEDATAISFESDDGTLSGTIAAGTFVEDRNYAQIELQVRQADDDDAN